MLQPRPTSLGTTGQGAKKGLALHSHSTSTHQGERAGTGHSHGFPKALGEAGDSWGQDLLSCHTVFAERRQEQLGIKYRNEFLTWNYQSRDIFFMFH